MATKLKIAFGLYDQMQNKSPEYREHVRDITMFSVNVSVALTGMEHNARLYEDTDITRILNRAADDNMDYLMLVSMGYNTTDHRLVSKIINEAVTNNYALIGHILEDKPEAFYHLHPQTVFVNLEAYRKLNKPSFGGFEQVTDIDLPVAKRSEIDIHDDYTPTYLAPTNGIRKFTGNLKEGWNIISVFLNNGYTVGNFSQDIRQYKSHMYPELNDDRFERVLAGDNSIEIPESGPTYAQAQYLRETDFVKGHYIDSVFVFNNDNMNPDKIKYTTDTKLDTLYAVAAGFKPLQLLTLTDYSNSRVVYIDYSEPALDYRKWLVENWDGTNYIETIEQYKKLHPNFKPNWLFNKDYRPEWDRIIEIFGGKDKWLELWNKYRQLEHKYIKTNLFGDYTDMIHDMKEHQGNNLIWFSNSFYTPASIRNFTPSKLKNHYNSFKQDILDNNVSIQFGGSDNKGQHEWNHYGILQ